jgi:hypothetical protein
MPQPDGCQRGNYNLNTAASLRCSILGSVGRISGLPKFLTSFGLPASQVSPKEYSSGMEAAAVFLNCRLTVLFTSTG